MRDGMHCWMEILTQRAAKAKVIRHDGRDRQAEWVIHSDGGGPDQFGAPWPRSLRYAPALPLATVTAINVVLDTGGIAMSTLDHLEIDTEHVHGDELPWVSAGKVSYRLLLARESDNLVVTHWRAQPGAQSGWHKHMGSVLVYTIAGTWGHRQEVQDYRPGSYVAEPVGTVHRFFAGPDGAEAVGYSFGDTAAVNEEGEVVGVQTFQGKVDDYLAQCEAQGFGRPQMLS
jgi:quercetin dioxygenase-like cupin family protein